MGPRTAVTAVLLPALATGTLTLFVAVTLVGAANGALAGAAGLGLALATGSVAVPIAGFAVMGARGASDELSGRPADCRTPARARPGRR